MILYFNTLLFLSEIDFSGAKPGRRCKRLYWADQQTSELDFMAKKGPLTKMFVKESKYFDT